MCLSNFRMMGPPGPHIAERQSKSINNQAHGHRRGSIYFSGPTFATVRFLSGGPLGPECLDGKPTCQCAGRLYLPGGG